MKLQETWGECASINIYLYIHIYIYTETLYGFMKRCPSESNTEYKNGIRLKCYRMQFPGPLLEDVHCATQRQSH